MHCSKVYFSILNIS